MNYNKTLQVDDYAALREPVRLFEGLVGLVPCNVDHYHRRWEYGLALSAVLAQNCRTVLDIGSGGSLFAPMAALCGLAVTCVDPSPRVVWAEGQGQAIQRPIVWQQVDFMAFSPDQTYDAVVCLSTIEHVVDDGPFFDKALRQARRLLVLTTDFSMDGGCYSPNHLRTYSPQTLTALADRATGWHLTDRPAWRDHGTPIFDLYNFASMSLCTT